MYVYRRGLACLAIGHLGGLWQGLEGLEREDSDVIGKVSFAEYNQIGVVSGE